MNGRRSRIVRRSLALALTAKPAAVGILALTPQTASAANVVVPCATGGAGLKTAIANANASGGTVTLASGCTYSLMTATTPNEGLPLITGTVVVNGDGATITRGGAAPFRIFHVKPSGDLTLQNVTVSNGLTVNNVGGAGIYNELGRLTITASTLSGNKATATAGSFTSKGDAVGGGILTRGTTTITNSVVTDNQATSVTSPQGGQQVAAGGGIAAKGGTLRVLNSTISKNMASVTGTSSGVVVEGGGISANANTSSSGGLTVTVSGSTLSGNKATTTTTGSSQASGGAIESDNFANVPPLPANRKSVTIINSTLASNIASSGTALAPTGRGGAIAEFDILGDTFSVINSTIAGNTTGGNAKLTGAVITNGAGTDTLTNTIIASSIGANCGPNVGLVNGGGNISFPVDGTCSAFGHGDPRLGPLTIANGGPTATMALGAGSAAIDTAFAIPCGVAQPGGAGGIDQRGFPRMEVLADPQCDIGAFEVQPVVAVVVPAPSPTPALPKAGTQGPGSGSGLPWPLLIPAAVASGVLGAAGRQLRGRPKS